MDSILFFFARNEKLDVEVFCEFLCQAVHCSSLSLSIYK
jgi:hypothetical protein